MKKELSTVHQVILSESRRICAINRPETLRNINAKYELAQNGSEAERQALAREAFESETDDIVSAPGETPLSPYLASMLNEVFITVAVPE